MTTKELPLYQCFKQVRALKIKAISIGRSVNNDHPTARLDFVDDSYPPISISKITFDKHQPKEDWYFIQYDDGYISFSPPGTFESGYAPVYVAGAASPAQSAFLAQRAAEAILASERAEWTKERRRLSEEYQSIARESIALRSDNRDEMELRGRLITQLDRTAQALFGAPTAEVSSWDALPAKVLELRMAADTAADEFEQAAVVLCDPPPAPALPEDLRARFIERGQEITRLVAGLRDAGRLPAGVTRAETLGPVMPPICEKSDDCVLGPHTGECSDIPY